MVSLFEKFIQKREHMESLNGARDAMRTLGRITNSDDRTAIAYQMHANQADIIAEEIFETLRTLEDLGGIKKFEQLSVLNLAGTSDG